MRRAVEEECADLESDDAQRELLQNCRAQGGVLAREAELRLDQLLPRIEILLNLASKNLAELGVDAAHVGGQRLDRGQQNQHENDKRRHGRRTFAAGLRAARFGVAARSIRPWGNRAVHAAAARAAPSRLHRLRGRSRPDAAAREG